MGEKERFEGREEIDIPPLAQSFKWSCSINTDRKSVFSEFEDVDSVIEIGGCSEGYRYKCMWRVCVMRRFRDCANVTLSAHSFRIYESVYHSSD